MTTYLYTAILFVLLFSAQAMATIKIVSLAPGVTEIVAALGMSDALVGVSTDCDYPADIVANRPKIGPFVSPNAELIANLSPTLVIGMGVNKSAELQTLENTGVQMMLLPAPETLPDLLTAITIIGNAIGKSREGKKLSDSMNLAIQRLRKTRPEYKFSVLAVVWNPPLIAAAGNTLIAHVIASAGALNTLEPGPVRYPKINREILVYRNPDVILLLDPTLEKKVIEDSAVTFSNAVLENRIINSIDPALIARPGPRIVEGITQLQNALREFKP